MADPTLAVHVAVLAALKNVCSCDVWDAVPQPASYPYVLIDFVTSHNEDFLVERMDRRFIFLSIWTRDHGQKSVMEIISEIETLNEQPLTLTTGECVSLRVERKRTNRDADNLTFNGQVTLRILTTH